MSEEKSFPSLIQQGKNLSSFTWKLFEHVFRGQANNLEVSDKIFEDRMSICRSCEYFDKKQTRCKECGCYLAPKVKFSLESCPIGSWSSNNEEWVNGGFQKVVEGMKKQEPEQE